MKFWRRGRRLVAVLVFAWRGRGKFVGAGVRERLEVLVAAVKERGVHRGKDSEGERGVAVDDDDEDGEDEATDGDGEDDDVYATM